MNELIQQNDNGILTVSSRQIADDFEKEHRNIVRDIEELIAKIGCAQNCADLFIELQYQNEQNKQWYKYYELTRDGFSLLVMGFTGNKALDWKLKYINAFNKMEHQLKEINSKANLLLQIYNGGQEGIVASKLLADIEVKEATAPLLLTIEEQKPLVNFAETVTKSCDNILMRDMAKLCCDQNIGIGEKRLYKILRNNEVLMRDNTPYQSYIDRQYFVVKESTFNTPYGEKLSKTTLVTPKGQIWIIGKLKDWMDINND